jgi:predicted acylesterase/phospholipase RssA
LDQPTARVTVKPPASPRAAGEGRAAEAGVSPAPRRAVVLSGGGAKGVFESGVLNAFAQIGLEPDVLTGSSVGAVNAVVYAEVLRARRQEGDRVAQEVLERALGLWQSLDRARVADLDAWGWRVWALGIGGPLVGLLIMWLAVSGGADGGLLGILGRALAFVLGVGVALTGAAGLRFWLRLPRRLRARIRRGLAGPPTVNERTAREAAHVARAHAAARGAGQGPSRRPRWRLPVRRHHLLRLAGLAPALFGRAGLRDALERVVPQARRLSEYRACGLDVRLTRTNLRTGRTEVSEHLANADLHAAGIDRGRRVLGDPRAVPAALASCAFPVAFPPTPAAELYPEDENPQLYDRLRTRAVAKQELHRIFGPQAKAEYLWFMSWLDDLAERDPLLLQTGNEAGLWSALKPNFVGERAAWGRVSGRALFALVETREWPQLPLAGESAYGDRYFDGGILDNTPLATALEALRDADRQADTGEARPREVTHEIFVVLLAPRPRRRYLGAREAERLTGPELGLRALRLQAEQRLADDVKVAEKFDRLLARERMEARAEGEAEARRAPVAAAAMAAGPAAAPAAADPASPTWPEIFAREGGGAEAGPSLLAPPPTPERFVRAVVTRIQPTWDLPWVLALDDRLGFERESAQEFQARGCRDALQSLHTRYAVEAGADGALPEHAGAVRRLLGGAWEDEPRAGWTCRAERCSLRATCVRIAQREAWAADPRTLAAPPGR